MRPIRAAATALVASLALSACNGDDPAEPMSSSTPSGSTTAPSTTPAVETPTEPALPKAATKATEAGARAFITYYWDVVNYAQLTGDVKRLKVLSGNTCDGCSRAIRAVEDVFQGGGHTRGGEYALQLDRLEELTSADDSLYGVEAIISVTNAEQIIVRGDGTEEVSSPKTSQFLSYLIWTNRAWRTDVLEPR